MGVGWGAVDGLGDLWDKLHRPQMQTDRCVHGSSPCHPSYAKEYSPLAGTSLVVQWLGLCASTAGDVGSIKLPYSGQHGQEIKIKKERKKEYSLGQVQVPGPSLTELNCVSQFLFYTPWHLLFRRTLGGSGYPFRQGQFASQMAQDEGERWDRRGILMFDQDQVGGTW